MSPNALVGGGSGRRFALYPEHWAGAGPWAPCAPTSAGAAGAHRSHRRPRVALHRCSLVRGDCFGRPSPSIGHSTECRSKIVLVIATTMLFAGSLMAL